MFELVLEAELFTLSLKVPVFEVLFQLLLKIGK